MFRSFLFLRLLGMVALVIVVAVVLGILSITRGSYPAGIGILAGAVVLATGLGLIVARGVRGGARGRVRAC